MQLKNSRSIQRIFLDLKKLSKDESTKRKLSFKFESEFLNYQPHLKDFSSEHYKIFDELALKLNLKGSLDDLFRGEVVNKTENRPALHHRYRINQKSLDFNFIKNTKPFIQRIKKEGFKNITQGQQAVWTRSKLLMQFQGLSPFLTTPD